MIGLETLPANILKPTKIPADRPPEKTKCTPTKITIAVISWLIVDVIFCKTAVFFCISSAAII